MTGKWVKMQMHCACHCVLHWIRCIYYLIVMFLALFCLHSRNQHHMWTCLTGWEIVVVDNYLSYTHTMSVFSGLVCTYRYLCVRVSTGRCLGVLIQLLLSVCVSTLWVRVSRCKFFWVCVSRCKCLWVHVSRWRRLWVLVQLLLSAREYIQMLVSACE